MINATQSFQSDTEGVTKGMIGEAAVLNGCCERAYAVSFCACMSEFVHTGLYVFPFSAASVISVSVRRQDCFVPVFYCS